MYKRLLLCLLTPLLTQAASTDPVGGILMPLKGNSDTLVGVPFVRERVFEGLIESISGNVITLAGTPGLEVDEYVYAAGVQPDTYYVTIASGPVDGNMQPTSASNEGGYYTITDNGTNTLTVDLAGDNLTNVRTNAVDGTGDRVFISSYWTLDTLMPDGSGIHASTTFTPNTKILLPDNDTAGINLAPDQSFFYYSGTAAGGEGWRKQGESPLTKYDDQVLAPDTYFIVRHEIAGDTELVMSGGVAMAAFRSPINVLSEGVEQDNFVFINFPTDTTLAESRLFESGAFTGSPSFTPVDRLLIFDNDTAGINKSASEIYFYYTGVAAGGPGWRKQGDSPLTIHDTTVVFKPGVGAIVRKGGTPSAGTDFWKSAPPYLTSGNL